MRPGDILMTSNEKTIEETIAKAIEEKISTEQHRYLLHEHYKAIKKLDNYEAHSASKHRMEREKGRREAVVDMSEHKPVLLIVYPKSWFKKHYCKCDKLRFSNHSLQETWMALEVLRNEPSDEKLVFLTLFCSSVNKHRHPDIQDDVDAAIGDNVRRYWQT
ncbi:hypothetical protein Tco_0162575 [Tanacetum coccineum]